MCSAGATVDGSIGWVSGRASILADRVAVYAQLTRDCAEGEALGLGLLYRLPHRQLTRREFPADRVVTVMVLDGRIISDGIGLQVGQASQLGLAEAMVAQTVHLRAISGVGARAPRAARRAPDRAGADRVGMISP